MKTVNKISDTSLENQLHDCTVEKVELSAHKEIRPKNYHLL